MRVSRRSLLRVSGGALVSADGLGLGDPTLAAPAVVGIKEPSARTLSFDCCKTGEKLRDIIYWADGNYVSDALAEIDFAFRDFHTGNVFPIDPGVLDVLHRIGRRLDTNCHFQMFSGYRSPKTNALLHRLDPEVATHSLHMKGQAVDIALPGRSLREVHKTALALRMGGVGYYPDADFLHVDVGRVRRWTGFGQAQLARPFNWT